MLWPDSLFLTSTQLDGLDPDVSSVASVEGFTLDGPQGIIRRAIDDCGRKLMANLIDFGYPATGGFSWGHNAMVNYTGSGNSFAPNSKYTVDNILVTSPDGVGFSDVVAWVAHCALAELFEKAMNRRADEDRYSTKAKFYRKVANWRYWQNLLTLGIPVVDRPLLAPQAAMAYNPGTFSVSTVAGAGTQDTTYDVAISYVCNSVVPAIESHPASVQTIDIASGNVLSLSILALNPALAPTLSTPQLAARAARLNLVPTSWNVYAGPTGGTLYLQNSSPLALSTKTYNLAADPTTSLAQMGYGQLPTSFIRIQEVIGRA